MTVPKIKRIQVHELKELMDHGTLTLIDVREVYEWQMIRIPHTIHIPKDQLSEHVGDHVSDKSHPIYLLCKAGVRSLQAAENLLRLGYQNVYSVDGGLIDWFHHGYPVEK